MQIIVNGAAAQHTDGLTVAELLAALHLGHTRVAVEVNGAIVPRSTHASALLTEGDRVEIVRFIGGG